MEIVEKVHSIPAPAPVFMGLYAPNVFVALHREGVLIDAGNDDEDAVKARLEYIAGLAPLKVSHIIISHAHPDHLGGAVAIREATGARLLIHSLDAAEAERQSVTPDGLLGDGELVEVGGLALEVVHTPGHSPGHICLYLRERKIMFTADHVLGVGTTVIQPDGGGDMAQYMASLGKLLNYDIELICPGHGPPLKEPRRKVEELLEHRREREQQVLSCLKSGKQTTDEMVAEIYPELDPRLLDWAKAQMLAHLIKLEKEGRVSLVEEGKYGLR